MNEKKYEVHKKSKLRRGSFKIRDIASRMPEVGISTIHDSSQSAEVYRLVPKMNTEKNVESYCGGNFFKVIMRTSFQIKKILINYPNWLVIIRKLLIKVDT